MPGGLEPFMVVPENPPNGGSSGPMVSPGTKAAGLLPDGSAAARCNPRQSTSPTAWQLPNSSSRSRHTEAGQQKAGQQKASPRLSRQAIRHAVAHSWWYRSTAAAELRAVLHGKPFTLVMVLALLLALFMNDLWVLCDVSSNTFIDVVLCIVMFLFTVELLLLSAVDTSYLLSFFQIMDVIGTVSMIFDISFMVGQDATLPRQASSEGDAQDNLTLLRATRAAKVGARTGRLSRVLRILRLLPCLSNNDEVKKERGIASMISGQLSNLLAIRVACLTIILVMVIPLFDIWTFPQNDHSLMAWVGRISKSHAAGREADMAAELGLMVRFYGRYSYGPYSACHGIQTQETPGFHCTEEVSWHSWRASAPARMSSALLVHTESFMVAFNMEANAQLESGLAMATMIFIIIIMIFGGLALSTVVTELTVRPLERMLGTVRAIASTVFKFTALVDEPTDEEEDIDMDSSNEMKLLERVVQKLAIIADLQTGRRMPQAKGDLHDEDWGILMMMHGKSFVAETRADGLRPNTGGKKSRLPSWRFQDDFGVSQEVYLSWAFNPLPLSKAQRSALTVFTISKFNDLSESFLSSPEEMQLLQRFVTAIEKEYLPVPFHSFAHAVDVVHGVSRLMQLTASEDFLSELQQFALLIAAVAHDLGHPGVNNGFLLEVGHELALQYNDRSPLENMHCAKLYTIVAKPGTNVFHKLTKEQCKDVRSCCIETILHTDMMEHNTMVKDLQMLYQMNAEVFARRGDDAADEGHSTLVDVFSQPNTKTLAMDCMLHAADVSNPCKVWEVTHHWALVCLDEFFAQGDQEKVLGIPVQFLNDREKLNRPNSQIGFIEFMIAPFFTALVWLWPGLHELGDNLGKNLVKWADIWEEETEPNEEEARKVTVRVDRVRNAMRDAIAGNAP